MRRALGVPVAIAIALALALMARPAVSAQAPVATLPASAGAEVVTARCVSCHGADVIVAQRLSQGAWDREIAKMERWGAKPSADERAALLAYLAREFGGRAAVSHDPAAVAAGEGTFTSACLACHGEELSTQQHLTSAAWGREVDKMVRWGAKVGADDKAALVAFLTSRWGPR